MVFIVGVSIATLTGQNGILTRAQDAKEQTEIASEKEQVELAAVAALADARGGEIQEDILEQELEKYFGADGYQVDPGENDGVDGFIVTIKDSGRQYFVDKNGNVSEITSGPIVEHSISPEGQITSGQTITITITATATEGEITKITKPDGSTVENTNTTTYEVSENGSYTFVVEQSNGKTTTHIVEITNGLVAAEFSRANGEVDIVFLNGKTNNVSASANGPVLGVNMTPVNFNSSNNTWEEVSEGDWEYSYTDTPKQSKWANAVVKDDSGNVTGYFVWIPRYAYKITYYDSSFTNILGYSDARGIVTANGGQYIGAGSRRKAGDNYVVHPTFTNDISVGGWDSELEGIWVAKYEASSSNPNATEGGGNTTSLNVRVLPGIKSWKYNRITNMYTVSKKYSPENNSHLMKNSEWGAVAYLSYSDYGIGRETKVTQANTGTSYYTGGSNQESTIYTTNVGQSTTENAWGIYDMNGNAWEYVASYVNNGYSQLTSYGQKLIDAGTSSDDTEKRTVQVYEASNGGDSGISDNNTQNYKLSGEKMFGDAIYETSISAYNYVGSWQGAYNVFPYIRYPFFLRGGYFDDSRSGVFCFNYANGAVNSHYSFRPVLAF